MESTVQEIDKIKYFMPFLLLLFQMKFSCFYFFLFPSGIKFSTDFFIHYAPFTFSKTTGDSNGFHDKINFQMSHLNSSFPYV